MRICYNCFTRDMAGRSPVRTSEVTIDDNNYDSESQERNKD